VASEAVFMREEIAEPKTSECLLEDAVAQHARMVYRIAYSVLRNHHDAEDITQETFVRACRSQSKLAGIVDLRAWLARIAWRLAVGRASKPGLWGQLCDGRPIHHQAIDHQTIGDQPIDQIPSESASADEVLQGTQINGLLYSLIATLPTKLRDPLVLSTLEELSPRDVAEVLGINEAAVRSRVFRARQILKEKLAARLGTKYGA
jgi:RNA polymerase sigma-70 factor, ECF subfamily